MHQHAYAKSETVLSALKLRHVSIQSLYQWFFLTLNDYNPITVQLGAVQEAGTWWSRMRKQASGVYSAAVFICLHWNINFLVMSATMVHELTFSFLVRGLLKRTECLGLLDSSAQALWVCHAFHKDLCISKAQSACFPVLRG